MLSSGSVTFLGALSLLPLPEEFVCSVEQLPGVGWGN